MERKKVLTPEELDYLEALDNEADLARLQRKYELMERDRRLQTENTSVKLVRQEKVLRIYKKEYRNIEKDLKVALAPMRKKEDQKNMIQLNEVLQSYDDYNAKIKKLNGYLCELDGQIYLRKHEILDLEAKQTSERQILDMTMQARVTLEKLENKLELHMKKFCEICYDNKKLRDVINSLMCDRKRFNTLWKRLISRLNQGKKYMLDIIEQATLAYDEREEWVSKLKLLSSRNKMIFAKNVYHIRELERRHDHMEKLKNFLLHKGTRRKMNDLEQKHAVKRKMILENIQLKLNNYTQMITEIFEFTEEDRAEYIAKKYFKQESENFSMFQHLIEINNEMEDLNESMFELDVSNVEETAKQQLMFLKQREKIDNLTGKLSEEEYKLTVSKKKLQDVNKYMQQIISGIENMFKIVNCSKDPLMPLLGYKNKIDYFNVNLYMQILESNVEYLMLCRYSEICSSQKKIRKSQLDTMSLSPSHGPDMTNIMPKDPCPLCIENEMVHDVVDTLQVVMNREEIELYLEQRLEVEGYCELLHNVSACQLPKSREIIQKRYQ